MWEGKTRREVLTRRATSLDTRIAKLEARITMKVENGADDQPAPEPASKGAGVRNPRPARRLLLGQMGPVRVEQNAEEPAFAAEASQAEYG
ncbi:MAG: hypothetical protein ACLPUO_28555 [Streptosporangiaceae bacterium]